jgi:non-specific serine/threonine protein kinase
MIPGQSTQRSNLPAQVSSFIGRERELEQIAGQLRQQRLVTLTGAGGIGKTRLALRAAAAELDRFADGVWLVELALLTRPELVVETIGKALKIPPISTPYDISPLDSLCASIRTKQLLLALDNCEHVIAACANIVALLLARCPTVTVLATSREPLAIAGEWVLRVPPLRLPDRAQRLAQRDEERLLRYDGIHLFVERAQAAEPSFRLTEVNAASVIDICRRLDGIPLALELAAVRVRGMGVAYLDARLDDRFRLLTGGDRAMPSRQQALQTSLEWSYSLLSEPERVVLRRLGIFVGPFSLEAAESVCAGDYVTQSEQETILPETVLEHLLQLVNKSLIQFDQETGSYRLLETIRMYGLERLADAGETDTTGCRHFMWYLQLAENGAALLGGPNQGTWFARLEQEHDNFRAALGWSLDAKQAPETARMALGLWRFWHARTYQREGLRWLELIATMDATTPLADPLRPRLFNALGVLAHRAAQFDRSRAYHADALRLWTAANDRDGMAQALFDISWLHFDQVEIELANQCAQESLALAESIGETRLIASALVRGAQADIEFGRLHVAIPALERSLAIWRELGDMDNLATALAGLAIAYQRSGESERAKPLLAESVRLQARLGNYGNRIATLVGLLQQAASTSEQLEMARDTARMVGVLTAWEETTSGIRSPWWMSDVGQEIVAKTTERLGREAFAQAVAEGKGLTVADLLLLAERITAPAPDVGSSPPLPPASVAAPHADLTPRELEVLRLVAAGLTNAQVAQSLVITPRTVNAHLTAIYSKLGVSGRSGAIRYAIDHDLG